MNTPLKSKNQKFPVLGIVLGLILVLTVATEISKHEVATLGYLFLILATPVLVLMTSDLIQKRQARQ
jgi:multisubunit Na+/H+ antiporter MnhG subunit